MTDRRQRQKEQRAAKRAAEKKAEARSELGRRLITALIFGVVVVGIFAFTGVFSGDPSDLPNAYETFRLQPTACSGDLPDQETVMTFQAPEKQPDVTSSSNVIATITTSCGDVVLELDPAGYPETVNSFVFLAREGFYNGQAIHRIAADFVIQGGDPAANGTSGPGYVIDDEFPNSDDFDYEVGVVAMANRGPRSTGSQFFIVVGESAQHLTPQFNVLGKVISGNDVLARIQAVATGATPGSVEQSLPLESVYIESVAIDITGS
jgi:cyclophilin family peptidyl-prolyl cis-trans isomerase